MNMTISGFIRYAENDIRLKGKKILALKSRAKHPLLNSDEAATIMKLTARLHRNRPSAGYRMAMYGFIGSLKLCTQSRNKIAQIESAQPMFTNSCWCEKRDERRKKAQSVT